MNRLQLVNVAIDIPFFLYDERVENTDFHERALRFNLLRYRRNESKTNLGGAPPYFFKWIHVDEYEPHYDKPRLASYVGLETVLDFGKYHLICRSLTSAQLRLGSAPLRLGYDTRDLYVCLYNSLRLKPRSTIRISVRSIYVCVYKAKFNVF